MVVKPREVLVDGKGAGTVSLIIWGDAVRKHYDVVVDSGVSTLQQNLQQLFPRREHQRRRHRRRGHPVGLGLEQRSDAARRRSVEGGVAQGGVVNMLQLPGGSPSKQVMLQVRFAEVNRNALLQAGSPCSRRARPSPRGARRSNSRDRTSTRAAARVARRRQRRDLLFTDFLNLFFFNREEGIGGVLKALQGRGFLQSLAEPNLIAYNGEEASFLAGGEIPIPVVQGVDRHRSACVYKEFGIRLTFRPTIAGDVIRLKLRPEVSTLDFNNGIILSGFRIPALNTRRAETDVELRDGQSFAIAGLMNNISQTDRQAIPLLSKLPIIGNLFKSKAERAEQTELMVLITPRLVRPLDPDEVPPLPTRPEEFIDPAGDKASRSRQAWRMDRKGRAPRRGRSPCRPAP